jgi:hypothetical protein
MASSSNNSYHNSHHNNSHCRHHPNRRSLWATATAPAPPGFSALLETVRALTRPEQEAG